MPTVAANPSFDLTRVFGARALNLAERVVAALRRAVPVEEVWVFGSCARGEARGDSDLDLLVVLADELRGFVEDTTKLFETLAGRKYGGPPLPTPSS